jgi:hypothetical protein
VTTPDPLGSTSQPFNSVFDVVQDAEIQLMTPLVFASVEQSLQIPLPAQVKDHPISPIKNVFKNDIFSEFKWTLNN